MATEWYSEENSVSLVESEVSLIKSQIENMNIIMGLTFGDLEGFDRYGGQATIYGKDNKSTGIELTHAIYGEEYMGRTENGSLFETFNRIKIGDEYVAILLTPNNTIREIKTNIEIKHPGDIHKWLLDAYTKIHNKFNASWEDHYFQFDDKYKYNGPEETMQARKTNISLKRNV